METGYSTEAGYRVKQAASITLFLKARSPLGRLLQDMREAKGWSPDQFGRLYGQALRDKPIKGKTIQRMEQMNELPKSEKRRYVLAQLLDIPLALVGLGYLEQSLLTEKETPKALNLVEYRATLNEYWNKHYTGTAQETIADVKKRINKLHSVFPYTYTSEKSTMIELLCGFNIIVGDIERDQQHYSSAMKHLNNAVVVARENENYTFYAAALLDRGGTFLDKGQTAIVHNGKLGTTTRYLKQALHDFSAALELEKVHPLPNDVKGTALTGLGIAQSHLAEDTQDLNQALTWMDKTEILIGQNDSKENEYRFTATGKFAEGEYHVDRAAILLGATNKKLRNPNEMLVQLTLARKHTDASYTRRNAFIDIQSAKAYFDRGEYPMATKLASDALLVVGAIESWVNIARISRLYADLKESSYGNSFEVAQLGVELMRLERPDILN